MRLKLLHSIVKYVGKFTDRINNVVKEAHLLLQNMNNVAFGHDQRVKTLLASMNELTTQLNSILDIVRTELVLLKSPAPCSDIGPNQDSGTVDHGAKLIVRIIRLAASVTDKTGSTASSHLAKKMLSSVEELDHLEKWINKKKHHKTDTTAVPTAE